MKRHWHINVAAHAADQAGRTLGKRHRTRRVVLATLVLALSSSGCKEKWDTTQHPVRGEEVDTAFFSGLDSDTIPDLPEPQSLRPCCIFGNDVGVQIGRLRVPGYKVQNVLEMSDLGTHQCNNGTVSLEPRGEERIVSDEASGILYTCRGGFIDIAHVRDNADRTLYLASQVARLAATGGTIPLTGEGAERRIVLKPLDDAYVIAERDFYVSSGYNDTQAVAGLLPVENGTVVVYLNRTTTDQLGGFGASAKPPATQTKP